jgi:uncharacterized protein (UPF0335 family)
MSADAEIKQFIDRILRLKEEQDTLGEDIREVYAEAKGRGYDKTVLGNVVSHLRKVAKLGNDTLSEREAIFDLYLTAYETGGRPPASARTRENIEEFPVDARLVATVANAVQTETGRKALIAAVDIMIEREERIDPETGEILDDTVGGDDVDRSAMRASSAVEVGATNSPETATDITPDPHTLGAADGQRSIHSSSPAGAKSDGPNTIVGQVRESEYGISGSEEEQAVDQFTPPAFLKSASEAPKENPQCQKAAKGEQCKFSHSAATCWRCTEAAMKEKSASSKKVAA